MKYLLKKQIVCLLFLLTSSSVSEARNSDYFVNFELANNKIYVLHADGVIKIFDDVNGRLLDTYSQKSKITILTKDRKGNMIIADEANEVKRLNTGNHWSIIASLEGDKLFSVIFDKHNSCFLITQKGLFDLTNNKIYSPDRHLAHSEWASHGSTFWESDDDDVGAYVDNKGNIWINFDHGEWGNDLFVFNQQTRDFIPVEKYAGVPYYEANDQLFSTVNNFFEFALVKYTPVYDKTNNALSFEGSKVYSINDGFNYKKEKKNAADIDILTGNSTYNPLDANFYFISEKGLQKTRISAPVHKFSDFTLVKSFRFPKNITKVYQYYDNEKHETKIENGYPQFVSKLEFTRKGKLVLLPSSYGVWLFDGKNLTIVE
jgi:hypothetical protein